MTNQKAEAQAKDSVVGSHPSRKRARWMGHAGMLWSPVSEARPGAPQFGSWVRRGRGLVHWQRSVEIVFKGEWLGAEETFWVGWSGGLFGGDHAFGGGAECAG